jgi:hypothetical protein
METKVCENDYVKFKKLLRFFVSQSNKNAANGRAELPTKNKTGKGLTEDNPEFLAHYGLEKGFNKIAGLDFIVRFFMGGEYNTPNSTYININVFDIVGQFENRRLVAMRHLIKLDMPGFKIMDRELVKRGSQRNRMRKLGYRSVEELGIHEDKEEEPNGLVRGLLDEYLVSYREFAPLWSETAKLHVPNGLVG